MQYWTTVLQLNLCTMPSCLLLKILVFLYITFEEKYLALLLSLFHIFLKVLFTVQHLKQRGHNGHVVLNVHIGKRRLPQDTPLPPSVTLTLISTLVRICNFNLVLAKSKASSKLYCLPFYWP